MFSKDSLKMTLKKTNLKKNSRGGEEGTALPFWQDWKAFLTGPSNIEKKILPDTSDSLRSTGLVDK